MSLVVPAWTSLLEQFGWGQLQDHMAKCAECGGVGHHDDDDECSNCHGDGDVHWGSFYGDSEGECTQCGLETHTNDRLFEDEYICLKCYLKAHKDQCGCNLFAVAEAAAGI